MPELGIAMTPRHCILMRELGVGGMLGEPILSFEEAFHLEFGLLIYLFMVVGSMVRGTFLCFDSGDYIV